MKWRHGLALPGLLSLSMSYSVVAQTSEPATPSAKAKADIIFIHGNVYTGVGGTAQFGASGRVEAVAVRGERVLATGTNDEVLKLKGPQTQVIDIGGHFVMPGFNDAHVHLAEGGFERLNVNMIGVKSLEEFRERLRVKVQQAQPGEWIMGGGWDETLWPVKAPPTKWDLDEVTTEHPVFLQRVDGHVGVANTRALRLASITLASRDPQGGKIDRDSTGQPTGLLRDTAMGAVFAVKPKPNHDQRRAALEASLQTLAQSGITSAQDNSSWDDFLVFEEIEKDGKLTARISEWLPFDAPVDELDAKRKAHSLLDNMLHTGMLKGFMDGSLGSHTAALLEPYADDPQNAGLPRYDQDKLTQMAKERVLAGFQLGFHAIGDKGVQMALDAYAAAEKDAHEAKVKAANGGDDFRLRIEHAQVTTPAEIGRFKELKVIASMQPNHLLTDMNWAESRLGPKRAAHSYAWADFEKKGVVVAFGTDYPVEPVAQFRGLYSAITRSDEAGKKQYYPDEKLTIEQAIAAYTTGSAYAEFAEKEKGMIKPGMLADFVILDRDITVVAAEKILETKVLRTVVGGKTVYEAK